MTSPAVCVANRLSVKRRGKTDYATILQEMDRFTYDRLKNRDASMDECWITQHHPVYTLGRRAKTDNLLENPENIPMIRADRGGDITWHGPGQPIFYLLLDIRRKQRSVKDLVYLTEEAMIAFLRELSIEGHRRKSMPGVYVRDEKIASLGFRVRHGCCYHGMSFNHHPDLSHFKRMHPCGYRGLRVTSLTNVGVSISCAECENKIIHQISRIMCYNLAR